VTVNLDRYPLLASVQGARWDVAEVRFAFELEPPLEELVAGVRCAGFSGGRVLVIDTEEFGRSAFPGGTLEPGEGWMQALERELLEETGARAVAVEVIGRIHFRSGADEPYRSHLPHPEFQQVVAWAEVEIVGAPTNPPDGERVLAVDLVPIDRAVELLRAENPWEAELLCLVADLRRAGAAAPKVRWEG
jgi:8-oxo-dGTP pyrophosphatase MutT (NUDIX family)